VFVADAVSGAGVLNGAAAGMQSGLIAVLFHNITIAGGRTTPSAQKINVWVGQKVILNVTSDTDDEIHAHIGGPGLRAESPAGKPVPFSTR
jgi:hypothetical protein